MKYPNDKKQQNTKKKNLDPPMKAFSIRQGYVFSGFLKYRDCGQQIPYSSNAFGLCLYLLN